MFTEDEKIAIRLMVKKELEQLKKEESALRVMESNSPFLSTVLTRDVDIPFLASHEAYHLLLEQLNKKLEKEWKKK